MNGKVLLYGDKLTEAIEGAVEETNRRRAKQVADNEVNGIAPETIVKGVSDIAELLALEAPHVPARRRRGKREVEGVGVMHKRAMKRRRPAGEAGRRG